MPQKSVKAGATDQAIAMFCFNATTGAARTGMTHTAPGLSLWYRRERNNKVTLTAAALTSLAAVHVDGGWEEIGNGSYRLDLPDAAVAASTGVHGVLVGGAATSVTVVPVYVELVTIDTRDSVRLGITALPNAAASAAGGLPVSTAGGLRLDTMENVLSTLNGRVLGTIAAGTHSAQSGDAYARIGSAGAALTALPWNASWDAEIQSEATDALNAYDPPTKAEMDNLFVIASGTATGGAAGYITLAVGSSAIDDFYFNCIVKIVGGTGVGQVRRIDSYGAASRNAGCAYGDNFLTPPDNTSQYIILADGSKFVGGIQAMVIDSIAIDSSYLSALNAEVLKVLSTAVIAQPGQEAPPATSSVIQILGYLYKAWRNRSLQTATQYSLYDDAGSTVDQKAAVSDDGTTFTKGEVGSGP